MNFPLVPPVFDRWTSKVSGFEVFRVQNDEVKQTVKEEKVEIFFHSGRLFCSVSEMWSMDAHACVYISSLPDDFSLTAFHERDWAEQRGPLLLLLFRIFHLFLFLVDVIFV